jgi:hypothetical protein
MMNKLLPILILLLLASCASATTLHGTVQDADTDTALSGIYVYVTGGASTYTDSSGRFVLNVPTSGQINFESESPCYYVESYYHDFPDSEIWRIFRIPTCESSTNPSINPDPAHPDDNGNGNGDHGETPSGTTATSTAGRWGGGLFSAMLAAAGIAVAVIAGVISLPATAVIAAVMGVAFLIGFAIIPKLTEWGVPGISWLTGTVQDAGTAIFDAFGVHFNTIDPRTIGESLGDGVAEIADTVVEVFIEGISEATGLSETMTWILVLGVAAIGLLMWYSHQQNQSMMYTMMSMRDTTTRKKK